MSLAFWLSNAIVYLALHACTTHRQNFIQLSSPKGSSNNCSPCNKNNVYQILVTTCVRVNNTLAKWRLTTKKTNVSIGYLATIWWWKKGISRMVLLVYISEVPWLLYYVFQLSQFSWINLWTTSFSLMILFSNPVG